MEGNYDGVEEYPNAFPIDWCKQVIKRFEEMSANQFIQTNIEANTKALEQLCNTRLKE